LPNPKPLNKYTMHEHVTALEAEVGDLKRLVQAIELKPGPEGRPGQQGQQGLQGLPGRDGKDSIIPGPKGDTIIGPPGQSIRGEKGDPGPDTAVVLAEVRQALAEIRRQLVPLNAEYHRFLKEQADFNARMAERVAAIRKRG